MSMFGRLRNNVCAIALLAGIASSPLTASKEFPEEPEDGKKTGSFLRVEASKSQGVPETGAKEESGGKTILDYFPDEVLFHIINFTDLKDLGKISSACARFLSVSNDVFKDVKAFKKTFDEVKETLQEKRRANPDDSLEHHIDALRTLKHAATILALSSPDKGQELGRLAHDEIERQKLYGFLFVPQDSPSLTPSLLSLPSFKSATLGDALYELWPGLALSTLLIPNEQSPFYKKTLINLGGPADDQAHDVFALIQTSQALQKRFSHNASQQGAGDETAVNETKRRRLLASELMHKGPQARRVILRKIHEYFRRKDYKTAIALLEPMVDLYPDVGAGSIKNLVLLYKFLEQDYQELHQDKIKYYTKKAVEMDQEKLPINIYLEAADMYYKEEHWEKAVLNYKAVLKKNPEAEARVYLNAGIALIRSEQFKEAIGYLVEAKNREAGFKTEADAYIGGVYLWLGDEERAKEFMRSSLNSRNLQEISQEELRSALELFKLTDEYKEHLKP